MSDEAVLPDSGEHSLLLAARLIAQQRAERNIQHRLLTDPGNLGARSKLDAIRTEIGHLTALRDGEPAALATESARAGAESDRSALQAIQESNTGVAMTAPPGELSEEAARDIVRGNLAALETIANNADRFAALVAMGSSAEEQPAYRDELTCQAPDVAKEATVAFAASVVAWEEQEEQRLVLTEEQPLRQTPMQAAAMAVRAYAGAEQAAEYSYIDTWNPEGLPPSHFHERASRAHTEMIAVLARLSDADAAQVIAENPRSDHGGSTFPAVDIEEVRAFRAGLVAPLDLQAELRQAGIQTVSLTGNWHEELAEGRAMDLADRFRAARDEAEFHRLFTDLRDDPAIGDDLIAGVAHVLTGEQHTTREAALGAIETEFHTRGQGQAQEQAPTIGGGR